MPAYVIADVMVLDPKAYESYTQSAASSIAQCGGRYLVRGGGQEVLEGYRHSTRLIVLEFPIVEAAKRWDSSAEHTQVKRIRLQHAVSDVVLVEGV